MRPRQPIVPKQKFNELSAIERRIVSTVLAGAVRGMGLALKSKLGFEGTLEKAIREWNRGLNGIVHLGGHDYAVFFYEPIKGTYIEGCRVKLDIEKGVAQ